MPRPFLDAYAPNPVYLPDGSVHPNVVHLARVIDHPNWEIGDHSYASDFAPPADWAAHLAPYLYPGAPERLRIGRFCALAHGVRFITASADHPLGGASTYPFAIFRPETMMDYAAEIGAKGDTLIGNDVWIGHGAMILPGVSIGDGAVIGAGSVVSRDVPAFAVAAGNPARVVKMRASAAEAALLARIRWWDRPVAWIEAVHPLIRARDLQGLERAAAAEGWL